MVLEQLYILYKNTNLDHILYHTEKLAQNISLET